MKLRTLAERLSRKRRIVRRLPKTFGRRPIIVSPDSQLKYLKLGSEGFDPFLLGMVAECIRSGEIVWDIGANVGVFSVAAAALGARVLAVEADPWLAEIVRDSKRLPGNESAEIEVVAAAISERSGVSRLLIAKRGRASNALASVGGRDQMGGVRAIISVPTLTLDALLRDFEAPTFVKIDVEGAESLALRGAEELLRLHRPRMLIETGPDTAKEVSAILKSARYELFDASRPLSARLPRDECAENTLAIPS
jgi:FkbM family methyltransferase